jgi:hypothetical protein
MSLQTASAVGIPSKTAWSSTALRRTPHGYIYVACGFSGTEKAPHRGREFVHYLEDQIWEGPAQLYQRLQEYWQTMNSGVAGSLAVVWQENDHITLMSFGYAMIGLLRDGTARWLIQGQQAEQVLEGDLRPGDRLILATARAQEVIPRLESWANADIESMASDLFSRVQSHQASAELAFFLLQQEADQVNKNETVVDEAVEPVSPDIFSEKIKPEEASLPSREEVVPVSPISSAHLIAPEKFAAGIVATQQEQHQRIDRQKMTARWWKLLARLQKLSWLRIGIVLVIIGGVIGALMIWRYFNIQKEDVAIVQPLEESVQEVNAIPAEQRLERRDAAKSLLERLQATRVKYRRNRLRIVELTTQVEQLYQSISGEKEVVNLPVFYDFRLVLASFLATRADRFEDQAVFLDAQEKKVITLNLQNKNNRTLAPEELSDAKDIVAQSQQALLLKPNSILSLPYTGEDLETIAELTTPGEVSYLESFGGNLYVLDKQKQQLWRVTLAEGKAASPAGWIRSAPGVNLASASSISIDGEVWIGSNQGNIYRLSRGERVSFQVQGLTEPFTSSLLVAAVEDGQKLVVVEPARQRLVVLSKDGVYQLQVASEQIGGVTDVFLSADESAAYLVGGSVVYRVEI